jgi:hypothetical protein
LFAVDGLFENVELDAGPHPVNPETRLRFHEATALTPRLLARLQHTIRRRVLRCFARHGLLEFHETQDILSWEHGGGFSLGGRSASRPPTARLERASDVDSDVAPHGLPGKPSPPRLRILLECWKPPEGTVVRIPVGQSRVAKPAFIFSLPEEVHGFLQLPEIGGYTRPPIGIQPQDPRILPGLQVA